MEQHPIPQQISSYQFRLVGDMTLKQFLQLAAGCLISLLIYSTGLHPILKWPLIIFFVALGAALAFLPFQERPLEKWLLAFFRSIYSPTLYYWGGPNVNLLYYQPEQTGVNGVIQTPMPGEPTSSTASQTGKFPFLSNLEDAENMFLKKIGTIFSASPIPAMSTSQTPLSPSEVTPKPREINLPSITPTTVAPQNFQAQRVVVQEVPTTNVGIEASTPVTSLPVGQVFNSQSIQGGVAQFSADAAPPNPPEYPNIVVGQVMDMNGKIIESAILEIRDEQGRPVRALRSNKAGHFMIVTPLLNGKYELEIEKEGFEFEKIIFETKGDIIQPMAIRAKNAVVN